MKTLISAALAVAVLAGCASAPTRPVLYPNAKFNQAGEARAQQDVDSCIALAERSGADNKGSGKEAMRPAAEGAAIGAATGAVASAISGNKVAPAAIGGAAVGGTAGAVHGALQKRDVDPIHRNFVQACLKERGYQVVGWK